MSATQTQVGGSHYRDMAIQPIEFTLKNGLGFCEGNVIKYVSRHKSKGGRKDLEKAIHYLQLLIEEEYSVKSKFRILEDGELIREGDEFLCRMSCLWTPVRSEHLGITFSEKCVEAVRRKVEKGTK